MLSWFAHKRYAEDIMQQSNDVPTGHNKAICSYSWPENMLYNCYHTL